MGRILGLFRVKLVEGGTAANAIGGCGPGAEANAMGGCGTRCCREAAYGSRGIAVGVVEEGDGGARYGGVGDARYGAVAGVVASVGAYGARWKGWLGRSGCVGPARAMAPAAALRLKVTYLCT